MNTIERSSTGQRIAGHSFPVVLNFNNDDLILHLSKDSEGLIHMALDDILQLLGLDESFVDKYICAMHIYDYIGSMTVSNITKDGIVRIRTLRTLPISFALDFVNDLIDDFDCSDDVADKARLFLQQLATYYLSVIYLDGMAFYEQEVAQ
jgi:hypothetical protein